MIIVVKKDCDKKQFDNLVKWVTRQGVGTALLKAVLDRYPDEKLDAEINV